MHPKIAHKIRDLVSENITGPDLVRKCLEQYVEKEMFGSRPGNQKPRRSNRKYYQVDRICEATSQEQSVPANTAPMIKNP